MTTDIRRTVVLIALIPAVGLSACRRDSEVEGEVAVERWGVDQNADTLTVADEFVIALPEDENVLQRVRDSWRRHERRETVEHLRHAASVLRREEGISTASARADLVAAVSELERLATEIAGGVAVDGHRVDRAIAHAHLALNDARLTRLYRLRVETQEREESYRVRHEIADALDSAAGHLERAAHAADRAGSTDIKAAVRDAHAVADGLRHDRADAAQNLERTWTQLGTEAKRLREALRA